MFIPKLFSSFGKFLVFPTLPPPCMCLSSSKVWASSPKPPCRNNFSPLHHQDSLWVKQAVSFSICKQFFLSLHTRKNAHVKNVVKSSLIFMVMANLEHAKTSQLLCFTWLQGQLSCCWWWLFCLNDTFHGKVGKGFTF